VFSRSSGDALDGIGWLRTRIGGAIRVCVIPVFSLAENIYRELDGKHRAKDWFRPRPIRTHQRGSRRTDTRTAPFTNVR
jgi:hypothetical protein